MISDTFIEEHMENMTNHSFDIIKLNNDTEHPIMRFSQTYANIHGYISVCVCVFGIVANVFNISVLTRKHMKTPVNEILTWLAVSDIITMMSYIPFAFHFYCKYPLQGSKQHERNSFAWMSFLVFHVNLTATTHTISIWMCVTLAIVRYIHITNPTKTNVFMLKRIQQTRILIFVVYISSSVVLIPNYLSNELHKATIDNKSVYFLQDLKLGRSDTKPAVLINVWIYALVAKVIPCLLMCVFGSLLTYIINVKIMHRRKVLHISGNNCLRLLEHSRTTKMLVTVMVLFVLTELPQGVLIVCSACVKNFFDQVYQPLGDLMDISALVNNSINFVLYCSMSTKFRETLVDLYCGQFKRKRRQMNTENATSLLEKRHTGSDSISNKNNR